MDNIEQVKNILAEELGYWNNLKKNEADPTEKTKLHGACCELLMYAGKPELITAEYLRERYKAVLLRSKTPDLKNRELDLIARNRAVKVCMAIARLGKKIKILEFPVDKVSK